MKKLLSLVLALAFVLSLSAASAQTLTKIVVGATTVPHAEVLELVKEDLAALGYELEIVDFVDGYSLPNPALAANELDANYFQHLPFLNDYNATVSENEQLVPAIGVHYEPFGLYSGKTKALTDLKEGGTITVPNDPSNETRALLLLKEAQLITLPADATPDSSLTVLDIVDNPLKLDIKEVDAATLPATLADADFAVINGNFALDAGLTPAKDAVFLEPAGSEAGKVYTNYVVVRPEDVDADFVKALQTVLYTKKVYDYLLANNVVPVFTPAE